MTDQEKWVELADMIEFQLLRGWGVSLKKCVDLGLFESMPELAHLGHVGLKTYTIGENTRKEYELVAVYSTSMFLAWLELNERVQEKLRALEVLRSMA